MRIFIICRQLGAEIRVIKVRRVRLEAILHIWGWGKEMSTGFWYRSRRQQTTFKTQSRWAKITMDLKILYGVLQYGSIWLRRGQASEASVPREFVQQMRSYKLLKEELQRTKLVLIGSYHIISSLLVSRGGGGACLDSEVGRATRYKLHDTSSGEKRGSFLHTRPDWPWCPFGYRCALLGVKLPRVTLTTHAHLAPTLRFRLCRSMSLIQVRDCKARYRKTLYIPTNFQNLALVLQFYSRICITIQCNAQ